jgi:hypothetical protein
MKKYIVIAAVAVFCLCGIATLSRFTQITKGQAQQYPDPFGSLSTKTRNANPNNALTIEALVSEVFNFMLINQSSVPSQVKNRIVLAETKYRNNLRDGVTETKISQALDVLVTRFNAPAYSRTNESEVRELRFSMMPYLPSLVGAYRTNETNNNALVNQAINPKLSPSEAVLMLMMMISQKQSHPNYQMTTSEKQAIWSQNHSVDGLKQLPDNENRSQEMSQLTNLASNLTTIEQLNLANQVLDVLGIEQ